MGIEAAKQELLAAAEEIGKARAGNTEIQIGFLSTQQALGEILTHTQVLFPQLLQEAQEEYEKTTAALARAAEIYRDKVQTNLQASGLPSLDGSKAQAASQGILAIKDSLDRVTLKLMSDFFKDDIFSAVSERIAVFTQGVETVKDAFNSVVTQEDGTLPKMDQALMITESAVMAYHDGLGTNT